MSFTKCLAFWWKLLFWCHSLGLAQPFCLLNDFLKFMFNFRDSIPDIVPTTLNPLTYLILMLSLCLFYRRENWDVESLWNLPRATQFVDSVAVPWWLCFNLEEFHRNSWKFLGALKCWVCAWPPLKWEMDSPPPPTSHVIVLVLEAYSWRCEAHSAFPAQHPHLSLSDSHQSEFPASESGHCSSQRPPQIHQNWVY